MKAVCPICPHRCALDEGQCGFCKARIARDGKVCDLNYGKVTSLALDPVEKKPFAMFHPGSAILSVGSFGCSMRCPFCQNDEISQAGEGDVPVREMAPEEIAALAVSLKPRGNIGVAYTYNEPLVGYEFALDCSAEVRKAGMLNALVTNGMILEKPLASLLPLTDAMNIDLKGFSEGFYKWCGGDLETVKRAIEAGAGACHVEITTLVIPGKNDSPEEMERESAWLAGVDPEMPLHLTRFFPRYRMAGAEPTPVTTLKTLAEIARRRLKNVFLGNC